MEENDNQMKVEAREILHDFAKYCRNRGLRLEDWLTKSMDIPSYVDVMNSRVPDAWEHVGYFVWNPLKG